MKIRYPMTKEEAFDFLALRAGDKTQEYTMEAKDGVLLFFPRKKKGAKAGSPMRFEGVLQDETEGCLLVGKLRYDDLSLTLLFLCAAVSAILLLVAIGQGDALRIGIWGGVALVLIGVWGRLLSDRSKKKRALLAFLRP